MVRSQLEAHGKCWRKPCPKEHEAAACKIAHGIPMHTSPQSIRANPPESVLKTSQTCFRAGPAGIPVRVAVFYCLALKVLNE